MADTLMVTVAKLPFRPPTTPRSAIVTVEPIVVSIRAAVWLLDKLWNSPKMTACVSAALRVTLISPVAAVLPPVR